MRSIARPSPEAPDVKTGLTLAARLDAQRVLLVGELPDALRASALEAAGDRLGNPTLVTQPLNSTLRNAAWIVEPPHPSKREPLRQDSLLILGKDMVSQPTRREASVALRGDMMADAIQRIRPGPESAAVGQVMVVWARLAVSARPSRSPSRSIRVGASDGEPAHGY